MIVEPTSHCLVCGKEITSGMSLCYEHRAKQFTGELNAPKPEPQYQETLEDILDGYYGVYPFFYWNWPKKSV